MKQMELSGIYFILKIILILPVRTAIYCYNVWYNYSRKITPSFVRRILMREAFLLGDYSTCRIVINPVFEFIDSFFLDTYQEISGYVTEKDHELLRPRLKENSIFLSRENCIRTKYVWYSKPDDFDNARDPILIFSHGGGFAIKLVPLSFNFLNNMSKHFPRMGIIIHDYTVTASKEGEHPLQLLETVLLYNYVTQDLNCEHVILMGESAGGNIVLGTLQFLQQSNRKLPEKAIVLSPWCNPTSDSMDSGIRNSLAYSVNKMMDGLSFEGLDIFTQLLLPQSYVFDDDPMLNVEQNFDSINWTNVLPRTKLLIVYGTDEILQHEIKNFIKKLDSTNSNNFNISYNVFVEENGAHIEPVLNMTLNLEKWSRLPAISKILEFIGSE
ncbi:similar to Saccharomyces cerevisiae YGR263C SAY1 Sterol deacetylase [Maudiozyma saulgeensis]|uniref:Similar to Saccharomyces cerevisiae YGR263C SAY1 Sterol deacetylase n=1 Tax=Maudiozyma saulgeensis TaxID=1789683 RepID=A0A1X7R9V5_9SACH|nr:similar to Saccharomyces cerevisiae YGR263C SAY1 Sterol deacetylase [Kazachstania saulgeensis]